MARLNWRSIAVVVAGLSAPLAGAEQGQPSITIASYYFGNYHPGDPRNVQNKGEDWSEWPNPAGPRSLNINCWNELTEGSYLEPDGVNGMKYLEAVREVFGAKP